MTDEGRSPDILQPKPRKHPIRAFWRLVLFLSLLYGGYWYYQDQLVAIPIDTIASSSVMIYTYDDEGEKIGQGSGFCAFEESLIVTNYHVIEGAARIDLLTQDGTTHTTIEILLFDKDEDIALLATDAPLKPLKLGFDFLLEDKDPITTISSPKDQYNQIAQGSIHAVYSNAIEFYAPVDHGSSGGLLLNDKGRVIGVISAIIDPETDLNYAISIAILKGLYEDYQDESYVTIDGSEAQNLLFLPDIFDDQEGQELEILPNPQGTLDQPYQPVSLAVHYALSSPYGILPRILETSQDPFAPLYGTLTAEEKKDVVDAYLSLKSFDAWWWSEENTRFDSTENLRETDPKDWDIEQTLLDLDILGRHSLAIYLVLMDKNHTYDHFASVVDRLPLDETRKSLLMLLLSDIPLSHFTKAQRSLDREYILQHAPQGLPPDQIDTLLEKFGL